MSSEAKKRHKSSYSGRIRHRNLQQTNDYSQTGVQGALYMKRCEWEMKILERIETPFIVFRTRVSLWEYKDAEVSPWVAEQQVV